MSETKDPIPDRDSVIEQIRANLKMRSKKKWSVKGGRGTSWGWIEIDAPPARRTWWHRPKADITKFEEDRSPEDYEEYDTGIADKGHMSPEDRKELAELFGEEVHHQGISISTTSEDRRNYIDRSEGKTPTAIVKPHWD